MDMPKNLVADSVIVFFSMNIRITFYSSCTYMKSQISKTKIFHKKGCMCYRKEYVISTQNRLIKLQNYLKIVVRSCFF